MRSSSPEWRTGFAWLALLVAAGMVACSPVASPAASGPAESASAAKPAPGASVSECTPIDLRTPTGERLDLTGTWETEKEGTRAGVYFLHQVGSCLWWSGAYPKRDDDLSYGPLNYLTNVFRGTVVPDFTVAGEWIDVR